MRTPALLLLLAVPLSLAGRGEPTPVELALQAQRELAWTQSLDTTVYPPSPYHSPEELPLVLDVERPFQAFNDWYYFALVDGKVWYKPRIKRDIGQAEIPVRLPWKPFGLRGGLPYRLDAKEPSPLDTTYADGNRGDVVGSLAFQTEGAEAAVARIRPEDWAMAGTWPHAEPMVFSEEFTQPNRILAITADDDELAVLSEDRQMLYRRKFANLFVPDEWMEGWSSGKKEKMFFPAHISGHRGWSLGRITAAAAGYKEGPDGRIFEWGPAAVSMETMVWLSPDGRLIYYLDSGTPPSVEHLIEPPFRGQYRGEGINSAASTILIIDRFGAMVTKIADFDLLGSTPTHPYCYFEECDDEPYYQPGDIRSGMSDIRLPPEGWRVHAPVLPPETWGPDTWLSTRVSLVQTGKGNAARELRVVGMMQGVMGTFHKGIFEEQWSFRSAPEGDRGFWGISETDRLKPEDLARYAAPADLRALHAEEPAVDQVLVGKVELDNNEVLGLRVLDFNPEASPWHLELMFGDVALPMELHLVQAWSRYMEPAAGPGLEPLNITTYEGTLTYDRRDLEQRMGPKGSTRSTQAVHKLLDKGKNNKFALVINSNAAGFEAEPKSKRRIGPFHAVALKAPPPDEERSSLARLSKHFWRTLRGHMGWEQAVEELERNKPKGCTAESVRWAASALYLEERIEESIHALKLLRRDARRFATFTYGTSSFFYVAQLKTLDVALDRSRESRSDEVRPNELRFNVISGVTTRIPYLARNIADVAARRRDLAESEAQSLKPRLSPLLDRANELARSCDPAQSPPPSNK